MNAKPNRAVGRPRKQDAFLDPAVIVEAAWLLVEEDGVDALTSRTLAAKLGVKSPALYWHVPSTTALHSLMVERMLSESIRNPADGETWQDWLLDVGRTQRQCGALVCPAPPAR